MSLGNFSKIILDLTKYSKSTVDEISKRTNIPNYLFAIMHSIPFHSSGEIHFSKKKDQGVSWPFARITCCLYTLIYIHTIRR